MLDCWYNGALELRKKKTKPKNSCISFLLYAYSTTHSTHCFMSFPLLFFTISNKNFEKEKDTTSSLVVIKVYAFVFVGPCPYMQCFAWPFDINGPVYYVSSLRYLSVVVFGLPLLRLHLFCLSLVPLLRLGLRTSIRWRSAWLSCTCGPLRAHFKLKVQLINMFNLPPLSPGFPPFLFLPLPCSGSFCHHSLCWCTF